MGYCFPDCVCFHSAAPPSILTGRNFIKKITAQDSQRWSLVVITRFSDKKMSGLLFGPQKSGRNNGVVVWRGSTVFTSIGQGKHMRVTRFSPLWVSDSARQLFDNKLIDYQQNWSKFETAYHGWWRIYNRFYTTDYRLMICWLIDFTYLVDKHNIIIF